jgi:hypothetical protein
LGASLCINHSTPLHPFFLHDLHVSGWRTSAQLFMRGFYERFQDGHIFPCNSLVQSVRLLEISSSCIKQVVAGWQAVLVPSFFWSVKWDGTCSEMQACSLARWGCRWRVKVIGCRFSIKVQHIKHNQCLGSSIQVDSLSSRCKLFN